MGLRDVLNSSCCVKGGSVNSSWFMGGGLRASYGEATGMILLCILPSNFFVANNSRALSCDSATTSLYANQRCSELIRIVFQRLCIPNPTLCLKGFAA